MELHRARQSASLEMGATQRKKARINTIKGSIIRQKRGKLQLSAIQKSWIETRIQQLVEINKALKAKGADPKLERPAGSKK